MHGLARYALISLIITLPALATAQGRPAGVTTAVVTTSTMAETVAVFGEVVAGRESAVAARVGTGDLCAVAVGDRMVRDAPGAQTA